MKRMLSILLAVVLCLSLLPMGALADEEAPVLDDGEGVAEVVVEAGAEEVTEVEEFVAEEAGEEEAAAEIEAPVEVEAEAVAIEETPVETDEPAMEVDGAATSGTCGENLTWSINSSGVLTISGTGDMFNYGINNTPWDSYVYVSSYNHITSVVIEPGVTSIGSYAFAYCDGLTSISLPESLTSIGEYAFAECEALMSITIPTGVTIIGDSAFSGCTSLTDVYYGGSESDWVAIRIGSDNDCLTSATIHYTETIVIPAAPTISGVANAATGVKVTWGAVDGATKYYVYRKPYGGSWSYIGPTTNTNYTDTAITSGTYYYYSIRSGNSAGYSSYSAVKGLTYLAQPTLKSAVKAAKGATVTWNAVTGAEKYRVYRKTSTTGWKAVKDVTTTSFTDTSATSGTYIYTVRALKGSAISAYDTKGISVTVSGAASLAQPVLKSAANGATGVTVTWNAVTGAEKYRVYRKTATTGWKAVKDVTTTSFTDTAVTSGTKYTYTVRAIKGSTISPYDTAGKSVTYLAVPKLTSAASASTGIQVTWGAVTGASTYRVYRKVAGGSWNALGDTKSTGYLDETVAMGTTYYYTVRAIAADKSISAYNTTGISASFAGATVYVSRTGKIHSVSDCSGMKYYTPMSYADAIAKGYTLCPNCF